MLTKFVGSVSKGLSAGGTLDGDVTITGDLTVTGSTTNTFDESVTTQLLVGTTLGSASVPSLAFGDANTGFYESADNTLNLSIGGYNSWKFSSTIMGSSNNSQGGLPKENATATQPTFTPAHGDSNTGIGRGGGNSVGDIVSIIAGGVEMLRLAEGGSTVLTGTITPGNSTLTVPGSGTDFSDEVSVGDHILVSGETRLVTAIGSDTSLTVNATFSDDIADDTSPEVIRSLMILKNSSNVARLVVDDNSRISLSNNDSGGDSGDGTSTSANTIFGYLAGEDIAAGGFHNTLFGHGAGKNITTGDYNIAIGANALDANLQYSKNIAIGYNALTASASGSSNTAVGHSSGAAIVGGADNVFIGTNSGLATTAGASCVAIGADSFKAIATQAGTVAIGASALTALTGGAGNVAVGYQAGLTATTAAGNTLIGDKSGAYTTGSKNTALGYQSFSATDDTNTASHNNVVVGYQAGNKMGYGAAANGNTMIGYYSGLNVTTGDDNVAVGYQAGKTITTDNYVVAIGSGAYEANDTTTGHEGTASDGSGTVAIGYQSMTGLNHVNCLRNTAVGFKTMQQGTTHDPSDNVAIGYKALTAINDGDNNVAIGSGAADAMTDNSDNVAVGFNALTAVDSGEVKNIAIGSGAMSVANHGDTDENVAIGYDALKGGTSGGQASNVVVGAYSNDSSSATADQVTVIGSYALRGAATILGTVAVGSESLGALTSGAGNIAVGYQSLSAETDGNGNTCLGYRAGYQLASSDNNVAIGHTALGGATTASDKNVAIGYSSMSNAGLNHGDRNVAIGNSSGTLITTGGNNVLIGNAADVDAATDNYQLRLGDYGALRYMTARLDMSGDAQGSFTNAGTDNRPATASLLKIPRYGFLKRVTCTVVTASGGTGVYNISIADNNVAAGTALSGRKELIGATATADSNFVGATFRQSTLSADGDTQVDIVTAKFVHIWEANQATDDSNGWTFMEGQDMYLYVCHSGTGNAENAQDAVLRITAEFWGED